MTAINVKLYNNAKSQQLNSDITSFTSTSFSDVTNLWFGKSFYNIKISQNNKDFYLGRIISS